MMDMKLLETEAEVKIRYDNMLEQLRVNADQEIDQLQILKWEQALASTMSVLRDVEGMTAGSEVWPIIEAWWSLIGQIGITKSELISVHWTAKPDEIRLALLPELHRKIGELRSKKSFYENKFNFDVAELKLNRARDLMLIDCTQRLQKL
jgi:hypothetical protein